MQLLDLTVERLIIHQVFRRDDDGNRIQPSRSHEYTNFDLSAMEEFKKRITDALGDGSRAVQMEIMHQEQHDLPALIDQMSNQDKTNFAVSSFDVAQKLADAQQTRSIPGGIVVVFTGCQGPNQTRYIGLIKAELHSGYEKETNKSTGEISLKFVQELLLTPSNRLYKVAGFFEKSNFTGQSKNLNDRWAVLVSDHQINKVDGKAAAKYFYADFLGCGYKQTSARTTKLFYEASTEFISQMNVSESRKNDLFNALVTYLKVDTSPTISAEDFAVNYFDDPDIHDSFTNHMKQSGLPNVGFVKDVEHIESKLKTRKLNFRQNIKIFGPSDVFEELVTIEIIPGDVDESGAAAEWTQIIIKDRIAGQE